MNGILTLLLVVGICAGILLGGLLSWHVLVAVVRLLLAWYTPHAVDLLLERLAEATVARQPWEPVLRGLRLPLPWPWPWRLQHAANQLQAGRSPAEVLAHGRLLPASLRAQAVRALDQGPEIFYQWSLAVRSQMPTSPVLVRQGTFLLAELVAIIVLLHFMIIVIFPQWERIILELGMAQPLMLRGARWFAHYEAPVLLAVMACVIAVAAAALAWSWRQKRRTAAARLLLVGSAARLPEAALGASDDFATVCAAAGWRADTPAALARAVIRADIRQQRRAAWLPALFAALGPLLLALPVGALVLGTMQLLITLLNQIEVSS